jgi:hypothetical protein
LYKLGIEPTPEDQGEGGAPLGQMPSVRQIKLRLELTSKASKKKNNNNNNNKRSIDTVDFFCPNA